jgi:hypothetical protein
MDAGREDVTALLAEFTKANDRSRFRADSSCVHELRRLAGSYMRQERRDHTLQATAVVHVDYL